MKNVYTFTRILSCSGSQTQLCAAAQLDWCAAEEAEACRECLCFDKTFCMLHHFCYKVCEE